MWKGPGGVCVVCRVHEFIDPIFLEQCGEGRAHVSKYYLAAVCRELWFIVLIFLAPFGKRRARVLSCNVLKDLWFIVSIFLALDGCGERPLLCFLCSPNQDIQCTSASFSISEKIFLSYCERHLSHSAFSFY